MQIPHGLLPWAILAPFLSTGFSATPSSAAQTKTSTKSVPECATGSSIKIKNYRTEFWIEVVFLTPIDEIEFLKQVDDPDDSFDTYLLPFRPGYPLRIESDYSPFEGALFNRPIISRELDVRTLFELAPSEISYDLYDSNQNFADYWSDYISNWTYNGFNAIAFNSSPEYQRLTLPLEWSLEKVCDSKNGTELRLQVFDLDQSMLPPLPFLPLRFTLHVLVVEECQMFMKSWSK